MLAIYEDLETINNFWGSLYMFTYIVLFICINQRIFIHIIADGYFRLKKEKED